MFGLPPFDPAVFHLHADAEKIQSAFIGLDAAIGTYCPQLDRPSRNKAGN
jgi:hypothetical protein